MAVVYIIICAFFKAADTLRNGNSLSTKPVNICEGEPWTWAGCHARSDKHYPCIGEHRRVLQIQTE